MDIKAAWTVETEHGEYILWEEPTQDKPGLWTYSVNNSYRSIKMGAPASLKLTTHKQPVPSWLTYDNQWFNTEEEARKHQSTLDIPVSEQTEHQAAAAAPQSPQSQEREDLSPRDNRAMNSSKQLRFGASFLHRET